MGKVGGVVACDSSSLDHQQMKRKKVNEEDQKGEMIESSSKRFVPFSATPEQIAIRERHENVLRFQKKWEWSDEDLLNSCIEYWSKRISKEDCLKEMPKLRKYLMQLHESEGFDIDVHPKIGVPPGGIFPITCTEKKLQKFRDLADLAIESYNEKNEKTHYEVVKVEKVNRIPSRWALYYLTFTAKDVSPRGRYRSPKTFQAKVSVLVGVPPVDDESPADEVQLCRIKPKK